MADDEDDFDFLRDGEIKEELEEERDEQHDSPFEGLPERRSEEFSRLERLRSQYRKEMNALGVVWIAIGLLSAFAIGALIAMGPIRIETKYAPILAIYGVTEPQVTIPSAVFYAAIGVAAAMGLAGIATLADSTTGVGVGLLITYLSLIGNILSLNLCVVVLLIFVVVQGHRVLKTAAELKASGVTP